MKDLINKAKRHFENLDKRKFQEDWKEVIASSCSVGFDIDELIK